MVGPPSLRGHLQRAGIKGPHVAKRVCFRPAEWAADVKVCSITFQDDCVHRKLYKQDPQIQILGGYATLTRGSSHGLLVMVRRGRCPVFFFFFFHATETERRPADSLQFTSPGCLGLGQLEFQEGESLRPIVLPIPVTDLSALAMGSFWIRLSMIELLALPEFVLKLGRPCLS